MSVHHGYEQGFDVCLDYGKEAEVYVDGMFRHLYDCETCEVKHECAWLDTGNIYIEYECQGRDGVWRPSGIQTTKSHIWTFVFSDTKVMLTIPTERLRYMARQVGKDKSRLKEHPTGSNPTRGVVVSLADMHVLVGESQPY